MHYDVFNGDADGIIALLQLRLAKPCDSQLITGVKRDIQLLRALSVSVGDSVTVLDISLAKNAIDLRRILDSGAQVFYADHHQAGAIPEHPNLTTMIDLSANICTGLIVDRFLQGQYHHWAITSAYGDNLLETGDHLAELAGLSHFQAGQLKRLGTLINYNGYGQSLQDLHYHPADLFRALLHYPSPFDLIADPQSPYTKLDKAYHQDMEQVLAFSAYYESDTLRVFELPAEALSYRVSGAYSNLLANQQTQKAHIVLTRLGQDNYTASLRAPLANKQGAGGICSQFPSGGGREAAGGINRLPQQSLSRLIFMVEEYYRTKV
ncbi:DHH family phosphoesterase [Vibrio cincinnatiensis]|uniref:DHH family phosphoesterase n=1 Tax=Vibrio cincinnatiensis TaxID=675 RepID=UPI001EDE899F|nr:DHH family phosphoesterase [Vibrio cincinnatiensis]MCG3727053.1 DHH family phosphoesterase [Vibrio cincinnatiensis]